MVRQAFLAALLLVACGRGDPSTTTATDVPAWLTGSPQDQLLRSLTFPGVDAELVEGPPPSPTGAPFVLAPMAGAPPSTSVGPGQAFEIAFAYEEAYVNPLEVIIYFDGGSGYFRVRIDLEEGSGQVRIPVGMRDDVCANLSEIIHAIQCNEALQGAGNVSDYLIMNLELRCDGSGTPTVGDTDTDTDLPTPPETGDTGSTSSATVPEATFLDEYSTLWCGLAAECDPLFYERYPDGIPHCENALPLEFQGCTYDAAQGAACLSELGAALPCDGFNYGPWRDVCARVWSGCP